MHVAAYCNTCCASSKGHETRDSNGRGKDRSERGEKKTRAHTAHRARARAREREHETQQTEKTQKNKREKRPQPGEREVVDYSRLRAGLALSMGKRENPQPASWKRKRRFGRGTAQRSALLRSPASNLFQNLPIAITYVSLISFTGSHGRAHFNSSAI